MILILKCLVIWMCSLTLYTSLLLCAEFSRRWCTLNDGTFSYYESDKNSNPNGALKASEIVCLAVDVPEKHGYTLTHLPLFACIWWHVEILHKMTHTPQQSFVSVRLNLQVWAHLRALLWIGSSLSVWHRRPKQPQRMGEVHCQGNRLTDPSCPMSRKQTLLLHLFLLSSLFLTANWNSLKKCVLSPRWCSWATKWQRFIYFYLPWNMLRKCSDIARHNMWHLCCMCTTSYQLWQNGLQPF